MTSVSSYTWLSALPVSVTWKPCSVRMEAKFAAAPVMPPPLRTIIVKLAGSTPDVSTPEDASTVPLFLKESSAVLHEDDSVNSVWPSLFVDT